MKKNNPATEPDQVARRIYKRLQTGELNLKAARAEYRKAFGHAHDANSIGVEYQALIAKHFGTDAAVPLPLALALALYLREGVGRGRGPTPRVYTDEQTWLNEAQILSIRLKRRYKAEVAIERAARIVSGFVWQDSDGHSRRCSLTSDQIIERLKHPGRHGLADLDFWDDLDQADDSWEALDALLDAENAKRSRKDVP